MEGPRGLRVPWREILVGRGGRGARSVSILNWNFSKWEYRSPHVSLCLYKRS